MWANGTRRLGQMQRTVGLFYTARSKEEFDMTFAEYLAGLRVVDEPQMAELPLLLMSQDWHLRNLLTNFAGNLDRDQVTDFFLEVIGPKGRHFPNCIHHFEYLANRARFLDGLPADNFAQLFRKFSASESIFTPLNFGVLTDQFLASALQRMDLTDTGDHPDLPDDQPDEGVTPQKRIDGLEDAVREHLARHPSARASWGAIFDQKRVELDRRLKA